MAATTTRRRPARRPAPRRTPPRRRPARRGPHPLWTVTKWATRWTWRATAWTTRQAVGHSVSHLERASVRNRVWRETKAAYGLRTPIVNDLTADRRADAQTVELDPPAVNDAARAAAGGRAADPQVRAEQAAAFDAQAIRDRRQRLKRMMATAGPSWWERVLASTGLLKLDIEAYEISRQARQAVFARAAAELGGERRHAAAAVATPAASPSEQPASWIDEPAAPADPAAAAASTSPTRTRGDGTVVNPVRKWNDLAEPDIDPFDFPEELPQHLAEVAALGREVAEVAEDNANVVAANARDFDAYVEYMSSAWVDGSILSELMAAREAVEGWAKAQRDAAEQTAALATLLESAVRAAEAKYGDWDVPRFDKAG